MADLHLLFPTPVYESTLDIRPKELYKIISLMEKQDWREDQDHFGKPNGAVTKPKNLLLEEGFEDLKNLIQIEMEKYVYGLLNVDKDAHGLVCITAWGNRYNMGDWAAKHYHSNAMFSGVFYPKCVEEGGEFHATRSGPSWCTYDWEINTTDVTPLNSLTTPFKPTDRKILLFPSHMQHYVTPVQSNDVRYSIAFNYMLDGEFGEFREKYAKKYGHGTNHLTLKF